MMTAYKLVGLICVHRNELSELSQWHSKPWWDHYRLISLLLLLLIVLLLFHFYRAMHF